MGRVGKFVDDKSYKVIALQAFDELYEHLSAAKKAGAASPTIELLVRSKIDKRITIPAENADELIEMLKICLDDE